MSLLNLQVRKMSSFVMRVQCQISLAIDVLIESGAEESCFVCIVSNKMYIMMHLVAQLSPLFFNPGYVSRLCEVCAQPYTESCVWWQPELLDTCIKAHHMQWKI